LTPAYAQIMHADASARDKWLTWILTASDIEHPGKFVARAHQADHQGGTVQPGELVADTLDELRAMLPAGLTRHDRTSALPPDVLEIWD
jgi:hypothetical protein